MDRGYLDNASLDYLSTGEKKYFEFWLEWGNRWGRGLQIRSDQQIDEQKRPPTRDRILF